MTNDADLKLELEPTDAAAADQLFFRDAEEAFAIASEPPRKATRAVPVPIHTGMSVADAFDLIFQGCIGHFRSNEALVVRRCDAAALHQVRVAMRRLRAALSLFKSALADPQFEALRHELRWFTGQLGEARNLDVFLQQRGLPRSLRKSVRRERDRAYGEVVETLKSKRLRLLLIDFAAWVRLGRWRQNHKATRPLKDFAGRRLYKWWQRTLRHGELGSMHGDERHNLRIEIKKLRYALEFVQPLHVRAGRKQRQFYKAVERLQESLGRLNDLATAQVMSRKFGHKHLLSKSETHQLEAKCLDAAQSSLDRLKKIGPYWTKLV